MFRVQPQTLKTKPITMNVVYLLFFILTTFVVDRVGGNMASNIVSARVESCPGCMLNKLADVKKFIYEDVPKYKNVEFKKIPGAAPELVFFNAAEEEVERIEMRNFNRKKCNELLQKRGFTLKNDNPEL